MQPNVNLNIVSAFTETLSAYELPGFCSSAIHYAKRQLIHLDDGQVLKQSFSNYIADFDLFESKLEQEETIQFKVSDSGIFIFLVLKGNALFTADSSSLLKHHPKNCCYLSYLPSGSYQKKLHPGEYKTLLITLRPDWFIPQTKLFEKFSPITDRYILGESPCLSLPCCPLHRSVVKSFKKLQTQRVQNEEELELSIHAFLKQVMTYYHRQLCDKYFTAGCIREQKVRDIEAFVKENFTQKAVEDVSSLADRFCVSEKSLHKLAKIAFGIPLREQVIRFRMLYSIKLLLTTTKPIYEIASMMGYNDYFYFSKAFKKFHKVWPSEIRTGVNFHKALGIIGQNTTT